jgi:hypothetical protein
MRVLLFFIFCSLVVGCSSQKKIFSPSPNLPGLVYRAGVAQGFTNVMIRKNGKITIERGTVRHNIREITDIQRFDKPEVWNEMTGIIRAHSGAEKYYSHNQKGNICGGGDRSLIAYVDGEKAYDYQYNNSCQANEMGSDKAGRKLQTLVTRLIEASMPMD